MEKFVLDKYSQYLEGRDYIDVGPLYGLVNETLSVASKYNPKSLAAADIDPLYSQSWTALRERLASKHISNYKEFSTNIDDPNISQILGDYDFVYSAGIIYHVPSPYYTLIQYRKISRRYFVLGSMVMPDRIENEHGCLEFGGGQMLFVPALGAKERQICAAHFDSLNLQIQHINAAESWPWRNASGPNYGPWWWLYSATTCRAMLETAGWRVLDDESTWGGRHHYFFCERIE
jgi:hypothetical protein